MGMREEPEYRQFDGTCRKCGQPFTYYNSVQLHPERQVCRNCEEPILKLEGKAKTVFKQIELMAEYRGHQTLGELAGK
jgi:hypothetical protein